MRETVVGRGRAPRSVSARRLDAREALVAAGVAMETTFLLEGSLASRRFYEMFLESGYGEVASDSWPHDVATLADIPRTIFRDGNDVVCVGPDKQLTHVSLSYGWMSVRVAAPDRDGCVATCRAFRAAFPATYLIAAEDFTQVPITFWSLTRFGPSPRLRKVESASWQDIEANYTAAVKDKLASLMVWNDGPGEDGQLILWQGPPGTGKTWALRALASEWASWAEFHYITDPDSFFVTEPSYMVDVLLSDSYSAVDPGDGSVYDTQDPQGKWRVLILEDTGELLSAQAKERYGQGLSRLLNVVDGMIGQGLRVLALVTTNDELGELHEAVTRPGRCASQIEFGPLSEEEARAWTGDESAGAGTIAELYSRHGKAEPAFDDSEEEAGESMAASAFAVLLAAASRPL